MARILVADDASMVRSIVCRALKEHDILDAADGQEALEILRAWHPDIAVLDWMMPGLTGLEVCQAARSDPATAATTFVMMTARSDLSAEQQARAAGIDHFIRKPVQVQYLADLMERLRNDQARSETARSELARPVSLLSLRYKVKSDPGRNRLMIRATGRPTEADLGAITDEVRHELTRLYPGFSVWIDLRGMTFADHGCDAPLERFHALVASGSPSKVGTLLDDLMVRMQVSRASAQAGLHQTAQVQQFTVEKTWLHFLR